MVGLVLQVVNFEYDLHIVKESINIEEHPNPMSNPRNTSSVACICRMITCVTTVLSLGCLYMRSVYRLKWVNKFVSSEDSDPNHINFMYDEIINEAKDEFGHHKHLITKYTVIDFIILSICPIPYYDKYITLVCNGGEQVTYMLSDFLFAFMILRLIFLLRSSFNYSVYTDPLSKKVCQSYGF